MYMCTKIVLCVQYFFDLKTYLGADVSHVGAWHKFAQEAIEFGSFNITIACNINKYYQQMIFISLFFLDVDICLRIFLILHKIAIYILYFIDSSITSFIFCRTCFQFAALAGLLMIFLSSVVILYCRTVFNKNICDIYPKTL